MIIDLDGFKWIKFNSYNMDGSGAYCLSSKVSTEGDILEAKEEALKLPKGNLFVFGDFTSINEGCVPFITGLGGFIKCLELQIEMIEFMQEKLYKIKDEPE